MENDSTDRQSGEKKFTLSRVEQAGRLQGSAIAIKAQSDDRGNYKMEPRQDLLRHAVESYLHQSHLSLSALAGKLDISSPICQTSKTARQKPALILV